MEAKGATILVVDDQPANLKVLLTFLEVHHFQIRIADSGERALRVLENYHPDIILLDVMMPGMNGFETCRRIKDNKDNADVPVIFVSALDSVEDKVAGFEAGGVDYITKPFQQLEVLARVNTHILLRRQKLELEEARDKLLQQKKLLERMSITDDLTGLHNRRYFNTVLEHEFQRSKRHGSDLSCLLLDLDHFKQVNDTCGHECGDTVLREFASILNDSVRRSDFVFRFGGEEFLILLPQTDIEGAVQAGEKIRLRTANEKFGNMSHVVTITVSIGISSMHKQQPEKPNDLIAFADKALYTAKEKGRNQVLVFD